MLDTPVTTHLRRLKRSPRVMPTDRWTRVRPWLPRVNLQLEIWVDSKGRFACAKRPFIVFACRKSLLGRLGRSCIPGGLLKRKERSIDDSQKICGTHSCSFPDRLRHVCAQGIQRGSGCSHYCIGTGTWLGCTSRRVERNSAQGLPRRPRRCT